MKLYEPFSLILIGVLFCVAIAGVATYTLGGLDEDNFIEELAEDVIKAATGLEIDLSPFSPEDEGDSGESMGGGVRSGFPGRVGAEGNPVCPECLLSSPEAEELLDGLRAIMQEELRYSDLDYSVWLPFDFDTGVVTLPCDQELSV